MKFDTKIYEIQLTLVDGIGWVAAASGALATGFFFSAYLSSANIKEI